MSMININGIPNLGIPGLGGGPILGGVPNVAPAMSAADINRSIWGNYSPQQSQATFQQVSGPLTQDPAHYAAVGAAYNLGIGGGFRGDLRAPPPSTGGGSEPPPVHVPVEGDAFGPAGTEPVPYSNSSRYFGAGSGSEYPTQGYSDPYFNPSLSDQLVHTWGDINRALEQPSPAYTPPPQQSLNQVTPSGQADFSDLRAPPSRGFSTPNPEFSTSQPDSGIFSGLSPQRGGIRTAGPQFPSDVSGVPNTESTYQAFPGSFGDEGPIRAGSNTGSANPFTSGADPVPLYSGLPFGQPMSSRSPFFGGAPHIGPTMGPDMAAFPGGGVGSQDPTRNFFSPSSPFQSGTNPIQWPYMEAFPGGDIGSRYPTGRDKIASLMSAPPQVNGGPQVNPGVAGGPTSPTLPQPTQPQMNAAQDMIRAGGGRGSFGAQIPPAEQADWLAPKINQMIYDIGNAGDAYSRSIGGPDALLRGLQGRR